jgi:hypothetical protein
MSADKATINTAYLNATGHSKICHYTSHTLPHTPHSTSSVISPVQSALDVWFEPSLEDIFLEHLLIAFISHVHINYGADREVRDTRQFRERPHNEVKLQKNACGDIHTEESQSYKYDCKQWILRRRENDRRYKSKKE